jgi:hypothetical protein
VIAVLKHNEHHSIIQMYSLQTYKLTFHEDIGDPDDADRYIKIKEIEQNSTGDRFACAYFDDGIFYLRTFAFDSRSKSEIERE